MFKEKEKSNSILKYAVSLCQGKGIACPIRTRLMLIRMQMASLQDLNAKWQINILNFWINRFVKQHHDALQTPEGLKPHHSKKGGVSKKDTPILTWYKKIPDGSEGGV